MRKMLGLSLLFTLLISSCATFRPDAPLQVTLIAPGEPVVAILDNCPALRDVTIRDADGIVWGITRRSASPNAAHIEMRLGGTPNGWMATTELANPLLDQTSYTLRTSPGGNELTFRVADLVVGEALTRDGIQPLERPDSAESCDADVAWGNLWRQGAVLFILGLLALLLVGTVVVKLLSIFVPPRTDAYFEDDEFLEDSHDDAYYDDEFSEDPW